MLNFEIELYLPVFGHRETVRLYVENFLADLQLIVRFYRIL